MVVVSVLMAVYMGVDLFYPSPSTVAYNVVYVVVVALYLFVIGSSYLWKGVFMGLVVAGRVESFSTAVRWVWYGALVGVVSVVVVVLVWVAYYHAYWGFGALVGS